MEGESGPSRARHGQLQLRLGMPPCTRVIGSSPRVPSLSTLSLGDVSAASHSRHALLYRALSCGSAARPATWARIRTGCSGCRRACQAGTGSSSLDGSTQRPCSLISSMSSSHACSDGIALRTTCTHARTSQHARVASPTSVYCWSRLRRRRGPRRAVRGVGLASLPT
jgi:hypothetical protein